MKNLCLPFIGILVLCGQLMSNAQVITFEDFLLDSTGTFVGVSDSTSFPVDYAIFENSYTETYWSGFAVSSLTDTITPGYLNDLSAFAGAGFENSNNYLMASAFGPLTIAFTEPKEISSIQITNATYSALSMRDGDTYAKMFGGDSGDDPDFFVLQITGLNEMDDTTGTVDFYLADFRFDDNGQDYILKDWTNVDLSSLGEVSKLKFALNSSDIGAYGMNTPAYFCLDNIEAIESTGLTTLGKHIAITAFPQPANSTLNIKSETKIESLTINDMSGRLVMNQSNLNQNLVSIDVDNLPKGIYILNLNIENNIVSKRIYID